MKDRLRSGRHEDPRISAKAALGIEERRSATRQSFIAEAQIVEIISGAKVAARTTDLVVHGCYVDTLNTFPVGTVVRIRLKKENTVIVASGKVIYRMPSLGMGIAFQDLTPESHKALEKWLSHTFIEHDPFVNSVPQIEFDQSAVPPQPAGQIADLIQLLIKKGVLSKAEADDLLKESIGV